MDENSVMPLITPFFRVKRERKRKLNHHLPPLVPLTDIARYIWNENYEEFLTNATISADPILYADDCIVVVTYMPLLDLTKTQRGLTSVKGCTRGSYGMIQEVVYVQDKLYAVDLWSRLLSFAITNQFNSKYLDHTSIVI